MEPPSLSRSHQLFLQRMMASLVMTDDEAIQLHRQITNHDDDDENDARHSSRGGRGRGRGRSHHLSEDENDDEDDVDDEDKALQKKRRALNKFLGTINAALIPLMECEIRTTDLSTDVVYAKNTQEAETPIVVRYHAFVNRIQDVPSKLYGCHGAGGGKNPHEVAYLRLILEHIIDDGNSSTVLDPNDHATSSRMKECAGSRGKLSRFDIINLRNELAGPHADKIGLGQADLALKKFERERWLVPAGHRGSGNERASVGSRRHKRQKKNHAGSNEDSEEDEDEDIALQIGPRTYMEIPEVLTDLGLHALPQFILHRSD